MVEFDRQSDDQMWGYLQEQIPELEPTNEAQRDQLLRLAQALMARSMPLPFILASVRSTAGVLNELETLPPPDDVMQREDVRRFIAENAVTPSRRSRPEPRRETRQVERERLVRFTTAAIREARSAKARHEIKKTRNVLLRIDQRELRRVLGKEADEFCRQINTILRARAAMF